MPKQQRRQQNKLNKPKKQKRQKAASPAPASSVDSTYNQQVAYFNKVAADFRADQLRKQGELGTYYGTEATPPTNVTKTVNTYKQVKRKPKYIERHNLKGKQRFKQVKTGVKQEQVYNTTKQLLGLKKDPRTGRMVPVYKTTRSARKKAGRTATEGVQQKELKDTRTKDQESIKNDFAARGVLHSGLYARKHSDYEEEFGKQLAELTRKKTSAYADMASEARAFQRDQDLQKLQARLEAARRRAAATGSFIQ